MADPQEVLAEDHIKAIGALVVNVARLESVILDLLAIFMQSDIQATLIAFASHQISSKIDTLKTFYSLGMTKEEREQDGWVQRFNEARNLAEFRNTIVHAYWTLTDGVPMAVRYRSHGYFQRSKRPLSAEGIQQKADEVRVLEAELRGLRDHYYAQKTQ